MNESNANPRLVLTVLAMLPIGRQTAQKPSTAEPFAGSYVRFSSEARSRLTNCFSCLSLWFSLPLVIWLSSGWIGLIAHWQAPAGVACLLEKARPNPALR